MPTASTINLNFVSNGLDTLQLQINNTVKAFSTFSANAQDAIENVKKVSTQAIAASKSLSSNLVAGVKKASSAFGTIGSAASKAMKGITAALGPVSSAITGLNQGIQLVQKAMSALQNTKNSAIAKDMERAKQAGEGVMQVVGKIIAALGAPVVKVFADAMEKVKKAFSDTAVIEKFAKVIGDVQAAVTLVWEGLQYLINEIKSAFAPVVSAVIDVLGSLNERFGIVNKVIGVVVGAFQYLMNIMKNSASVITELLKGNIKGALENVKKTATEAVSGFPAIFTEAEKTGENVLNRFNGLSSKYQADAIKVLKSSVQTSTEAGNETKEEEAKTLAERIQNLEQYKELQANIIKATVDDEKIRAQKLKELDKSVLEQKKSMMQDAAKTIIENNGNIEDKSIESMGALEQGIIEVQKALNEFDDKPPEMTWLDKLKDKMDGVLDNIFKMSKGIADSIIGFSSLGLNDLKVYDAEIEKAQKKLDEFNKAQEDKKEEDDSDYEERIARLDEEYALAKEIGDEMTALAIENKKKELVAQKKEEKKKLEEEKKVAEEKKQLENELAMAEYNKAVASWQNEVKLAEQEKNKAIADGVISTAQGAVMGTLAFARSAVDLGPIAGPIAGAALVAGILASIAGAVSSVQSASNALESVKASPPAPPQFAYGTGGYALKNNQYAIVGEQGPEMVRQRAGGDLEVISTERTKSLGERAGMYIENVIFNVSQVLNENEIFEAMNNYKARNSFMYTR